MQVLHEVFKKPYHFYYAYNVSRKLQDRLEYHGVDYNAAAAAASNYSEGTDFASEKVSLV